MQVTQSDFEAALSEVQPAFGANTENLSKAMTHGVIDYGDAYRHLANTLRTLVSQVSASWQLLVVHLLTTAVISANLRLASGMHSGTWLTR
jgi:vesicle-fusing ATPase